MPSFMQPSEQGTLAEEFRCFAKGRVFEGALLLPGEPEFAKRIALDNGGIAIKPRLLVCPAGPADVATAVSFAATAGLPLSVKGGGHGSAGYCLVEGGLTVDMTTLDQVRLAPDGSIVSIQAGARWMAVYRAVEAHDRSLCVVGGACADVGTVGFLLGGGYSFISRRFGLGADHLRSLRIVLADGGLVTASRHEHPDLFWACRGGGGGNFGVVVDVEIETVRLAQPGLAFVECRFETGSIVRLMEAYHGWADALPQRIAAYGRWFAPGGEAPGQRIDLTCVGDCPLDKLLEAVRPICALGGTLIDAAQRTMGEFASSLGGRTALTGRPAYIRSGMVYRSESWPTIAEVARRYMENAPDSETVLIWTHTGGRIADVAPEDTAFCHRQARYLLEIKSLWKAPSGRQAGVQWAIDFFDALAPEFTGAYVNYADPSLRDWMSAYYAQNAARLGAVKRAYDPDRLFDFEQAIGRGRERETVHDLR